MLQFQSSLLAYIFSALLPPLNPDERDFYGILGVPQNATNEQIRKAYKVKSLKLHPDKVAQRRGNMEEAAKEYELVQEAYGVLVQDTKRQRYHALQCSPSRYRFVAQGAFSNPAALYENLTNATVSDKTRLVVLCTVIILALLIQPILIAAKVNHIVEQSGGLEDTKWTVLLLPTWIMGGLYILFWILILVLSAKGSKATALLSLLENFFWYLGIIFLAKKWDNTWTSDYSQILIPVYLAMIFRWFSSMALMQTIRHDVGRMVTVDYLEREVLQGVSLEDMLQSEQERIRTQYLIVTVPPDFTPYVPEPEDGREPEPLDDKEIEVQKVEASPEYEAATEIYNDTFGRLLGSLIFGITFLIVVTRKLDGKIDANYWVVFLPVWIHYGLRWLYTCFQYTCTAVSEEEVIMHMQMQQQQNQGETEETKEESHPTTDAQSMPPTNQSAAPTGNTVMPKETPTPASPPTSPKKAETKKENGEHTETTTGEGDVHTSAEEKKEGDDETERIDIDEDTFRAWQNAYDSAERGAMESQAKAGASCFGLTIELILLFMIVAKIDKNAGNDDPDDVGFNTFWILFPFFLFFGLILCCCACLIYGAAPGAASDFNENHETADVETPASPTSEPIFMEPTETDFHVAPEPIPATTSPISPSKPQATPMANPDMDDLD